MIMKTMNASDLIQQIDSTEMLERLLVRKAAVLLLFGAPNCGVCQTLKPRIAEMLSQEFPLIQMAYIDCEAQAEIAASHNVFCLPVVECVFYGKTFGRFAKVFSLADIRGALARPYTLIATE
ncbi:thioredoxin family protein [Shewanella putrefaciens]|uniref:Thioredoxin family protein n=1 Tax=Shewanella putrefaciens TaxID=24 RepID=A0ABX8XCQ6_SHEPU|nr:thioredoxin family protein [Shewanella putrefaciens]MCT8943565.1 thioredoxin family protein [Shewanella putrefaciens]QSE49957.1 thioredoxin family protein [Shewanella putrefaciens]QYX73367.1 thioredoxin family protein [Shewanella putrefaciens]GGN19889.1 thiol reductase thioredoxin [Shewanella putrefaciens]